MPRYTVQILVLHEIIVTSPDDSQAVTDALAALPEQGEEAIYHRVCLQTDRSEVQEWTTAALADLTYVREALRLPSAERLRP